MKQYRKWSLASLFVCLFFLCGCDSTSMKDVAVSSPENPHTGFPDFIVIHSSIYF